MLGLLTYSLAALASLAVCSLLLVRRRDVEVARRAAIAAAASTVWALVLAYDAVVGQPLGWGTLIADGVRYGAWLLTLQALLPAGSSPWLRRWTLGVCAGLVVYAAYGWLAQRLPVLMAPPDNLFGVAGLLPVFAGLVTTEQVIRNASASASRSVRLWAAGIGGQFAYDLFLYSQAQLLGDLDSAAWTLRGLAVVAFLVPLTLGVWRLPASVMRAFVSRHVVFYTSTFVAVGLYLSLMATGGYYVRERGGSWGNALQIVFLCGAAAVLISVLLSESDR